ncbi:MAG: hypothetical protein K6G81_11650 [Lachnospiraceae bacterium]|nr:hypothetical protein [Lachnospiraceae bacterium]
MKYSLDEAARLIVQRSDEIRKQRRRGIYTSMGTLAALMLIAMAAAIYRFAGFGEVAASYSVYGAFMLPEAAGGYILVAVLSFAAAVIITIICMKIAAGKHRPDGGSPQNIPGKEET